MDRRNLKNLGSIKGNLSFNEPLKKYTSMRVGGPAEIFFQPYDLKRTEIVFIKIRYECSYFLAWKRKQFTDKRSRNIRCCYLIVTDKKRNYKSK